MRTGTSSAGFV